MRAMVRAGVVVEKALLAAVTAVADGATTADVDAAAAAEITRRKATSNFLGYHGYPATTCVSVNEEIVHGIPGPRVLASGDIVSIDCGAIVDGWHGDSAVSLIVGGEGTAPAVALIEGTRRALWAGIGALVTADRVVDVSAAMEDSAYADGLVPVDDFVGHGIGRAMHEAPDVPNFRTRGSSPRVRPGMCLALEPMLTRGSAAIRVLDDGWTAVTASGSLSAHWEHSVAIHDDGIWVLTATDGGAANLAPFGVVPVAP
jgi:methionyl aminopeptidase